MKKSPRPRSDRIEEAMCEQMFSVTLDEFEDTELSSIGHFPSYFSVSRGCGVQNSSQWRNDDANCIFDVYDIYIYIWYYMIMYVYIYIYDNIHIVRGIPRKQRMISVFFKSGNWYWRGKTNDPDVNWCLASVRINRWVFGSIPWAPGCWLCLLNM